MSNKTKFWVVYAAIAVVCWIWYSNAGDSKYYSAAYNLGGALVWPISMWKHL